jgi:hypothetical protein
MHVGWYGHDCSRKVAGAPTEEGRIPKHHWLKVCGPPDWPEDTCQDSKQLYACVICGEDVTTTDCCQLTASMYDITETMAGANATRLRLKGADRIHIEGL